jgi:alkylresorcinol/alkylpyrone synthase
MACPVALLSLATATPPHTLDQAEALAVAHDVLATDYADFERMTQVFASAGIARRHLARPIAWYRQPRSFPERTAAYLEPPAICLPRRQPKR